AAPSATSPPPWWTPSRQARSSGRGSPSARRRDEAPRSPVGLAHAEQGSRRARRGPCHGQREDGGLTAAGRSAVVFVSVVVGVIGVPISQLVVEVVGVVVAAGVPDPEFVAKSVKIRA